MPKDTFSHGMAICILTNWNGMVFNLSVHAKLLKTYTDMALVTPVYIAYSLIGVRHAKTLLRAYADSEEPRSMCSLIRAIAVR